MTISIKDTVVILDLEKFPYHVIWTFSLHTLELEKQRIHLGFLKCAKYPNFNHLIL